MLGPYMYFSVLITKIYLYYKNKYIINHFTKYLYRKNNKYNKNIKTLP